MARRGEDAPTPISEWLAAQYGHTDPECAEAATHVLERFPLAGYYNHAKVLRILAAEESPYLNGLRRLTDEYRELFNLDPTTQFKETGVVGSLIPVNREQCQGTVRSGKKQCPRDAIPGAGYCSAHGGSWITEDERARIVEVIGLRLTELSMRATRVLGDLMDNAKSEMVRMQAATAILDRIGAGPHATVTLDITQQAEEEAQKVREGLLSLAASNGKRVVNGEVVEPESEAETG